MKVIDVKWILSGRGKSGAECSMPMFDASGFVLSYEIMIYLDLKRGSLELWVEYRIVG